MTAAFELYILCVVRNFTVQSRNLASLKLKMLLTKVALLVLLGYRITHRNDLNFLSRPFQFKPLEAVLFLKTRIKQIRIPNCLYLSLFSNKYVEKILFKRWRILFIVGLR